MVHEEGLEPPMEIPQCKCGAIAAMLLVHCLNYTIRLIPSQ